MLTVESLNGKEAIFLDPPYTIHGGKRAGSRLYTHHIIDHPKLFKTLYNLDNDFLMTYDYAPEIVNMIEQYQFHAVCVYMQNSHHDTIPELVITRKPIFS